MKSPVILFYCLSFLQILFVGPAVIGSAKANPLGGVVTEGIADIGLSTDGNLLINQHSSKAIINWEDFSISLGEVTRFSQPGRDASVLNRVFSGVPSSLNGRLEADGNVFVINPNGIFVGPNGSIDVGGLVLSTLDVSNSDFLGGEDLLFSGGSTGASVVNAGQIRATHGDIFLVGTRVENSGSLTAPMGVVGLGAGDEVLITSAPNELGERVQVRTSTRYLGGTGVSNTGAIEAATVELKAAGNPYALAINNEGAIRATGVVSEAGKVFLRAPGGTVTNIGQISATLPNGAGGNIHVEAEIAKILGPLQASASSQGVDGGAVSVIGEEIYVGAAVEAEGENGGSITIGGPDFTSLLSLEADSVVSVDGRNGSGGNIQMYGNTTTLAGSISSFGKQVGGSISVDGLDIALEPTTQVLAEGGTGGTISFGSELTSSVKMENGSVVSANGREQSGGTVNVQGDSVSIGNQVSSDGQSDGGEVRIEGRTLVNILPTSVISVDGQINGGDIRLGSNQTNETSIQAGSVISAEGASGDGGSIATQADTLSIGGELSASGEVGGGSLSFAGQTVTVLESAKVRANGNISGGTIIVGGTETRTVEIEDGASLEATGKSGGRIDIEALGIPPFGAEQTKTIIGGRLDTSGTESGGEISATSELIDQLASARITASGPDGVVSYNSPPPPAIGFKVKEDMDEGFRERWAGIAERPDPQISLAGGIVESDIFKIDSRGDVNIRDTSISTTNSIEVNARSLEASESYFSAPGDVRLKVSEDISLYSVGVSVGGDIDILARNLLLSRPETKTISVGYGKSREIETGPPTLVVGRNVYVSLSNPEGLSTFRIESGVLYGQESVAVETDIFENFARVLRRENWVKKRPRPWKSHRWYLVDHWTASSPSVVGTQGELSISADVASNSGTIYANSVSIQGGREALIGLGEIEETTPIWETDLGVVTIGSNQFALPPNYIQTSKDREYIDRLDELGFYKRLLADNWKHEIPDPTILAHRIVATSLDRTGKAYLSDEWNSPLEQLIGLIKNSLELQENGDLDLSINLDQQDTEKLEVSFLGISKDGDVLVEQLYIPKDFERAALGGAIEATEDIAIQAETIVIDGTVDAGGDVTLVASESINLETRTAPRYSIGSADGKIGNVHKQLVANEIQQPATIIAGGNFKGTAPQIAFEGVEVGVKGDIELKASNLITVSGAKTEESVTLDTGNVGPWVNIDPFATLTTFVPGKIVAGNGISFVSPKTSLTGVPITSDGDIFVETDALFLAQPDFSTNIEINSADLSWGRYSRVKRIQTKLSPTKITSLGGDISFQNSSGETILNAAEVAARGYLLIEGPEISIGTGKESTKTRGNSTTFGVDSLSSVTSETREERSVPSVLIGGDGVAIRGSEIELEGPLVYSDGAVTVEGIDTIQVVPATNSVVSESSGFGLSYGSSALPTLPSTELFDRLDRIKDAGNPTSRAAEIAETVGVVWDTGVEIAEGITDFYANGPPEKSPLSFNLGYTKFSSSSWFSSDVPTKISGKNIEFLSGGEIALRGGVRLEAIEEIVLETKDQLLIEAGESKIDAEFESIGGSLSVSLAEDSFGLAASAQGSRYDSQEISYNYAILSAGKAISLRGNEGLFQGVSIAAPHISGEFDESTLLISLQNESSSKTQNWGVSANLYPVFLPKEGSFQKGRHSTLVAETLSTISGREIDWKTGELKLVGASFNAEPNRSRIEYENLELESLQDKVRSSSTGLRLGIPTETAFQVPARLDRQSSSNNREIAASLDAGGSDLRGEWRGKSSGYSVFLLFADSQKAKKDVTEVKRALEIVGKDLESLFEDSVEVNSSRPDSKQEHLERFEGFEESVASEEGNETWKSREKNSDQGAGKSEFTPYPVEKPPIRKKSVGDAEIAEKPILLDQPEHPVPSSEGFLDEQLEIISETLPAPTSYDFTIDDPDTFFDYHRSLLHHQGFSDEEIAAAKIAFKQVWGDRSLENWEAEPREIALAAAIREGELVVTDGVIGVATDIVAGKELIRSGALYALADHAAKDSWWDRQALKAQAIATYGVFFLDSASDISLKGIGKKAVGKTVSSPGKELHRPYIRKPVRTEVDARAPRTVDGRPIDPNTRQPIDGKPDLGHKPGHEFRREKAKAEADGLSQSEFNDRMNDPDLYQLESPSSNRSRRFEKKD